MTELSALCPSYGGTAAENVTGWCTVMGGSAADTVMGDLLLTLLWGDLLLTLLWGICCWHCYGGSAAGGPQVVQHSCMGTAVLHNLCGSAAVAKLQLPSSNLPKHDGCCSFATAAGPHWQVTLQRNLPMLVLMGDTPVTWWRHVCARQAFFS